VARRATAIKDARSAAKGAVLVLDAGGTLTGQDLSNNTEGKVIIDAMNALQYDAMAVGRLELDLGFDELLARAKEANFPLLSCNTLDHNGKLIFEPYIVIQRDGARLGILGVTEPEAADAAAVSGRITVADPTESVRKYVAELRSKADVVILLSRLGVERNIALGEAVPGINVIVNGGSRDLLNDPMDSGSATLVSAGYDGEWLGHLDISFDAAGKMIERMVQTVTLGPEIPSDPDLASLVETYKAQYPPTDSPEE